MQSSDQPDPVTGPDPVSKADPANPAEPDTTAEAATPAEPAKNEPAAKKEPVDETQPVAAAEPADETQPVAAAAPETNVAPVTDAEPETKIEPVTDAEPEAEAEPVAEAEPEAEAEPVPSAAPAAGAAGAVGAAASASLGAGARKPGNGLVPGVLAVLAVAAVVVGVFVIAPSEDTADPAAAPTAPAATTAPAAPSAAATPSAAVKSSNLSAIKVTGSGKPTLEIPTPFAVEKTSKRVLTAGTGKAVATGQRVTIDYVGVNGTDGKQFDTSFGKPDPVTFIVGDKNLIKGMNDGLSGVSVGSRVLLAIPAVDGYGSNGAPDAGIGPTDTLLFVVDVKSATTPLDRATGTAVAPKAGQPTVALDSASGKPTITVPKSAAPTSLVVQPLIKGEGATVAKGQNITVHYTGVIWASGKEFDSSWTNGAPASFAIGTGNVIPGWDKGLVGQKVGSQVLLVIPPADGYGATGAPQAGIGATDTLVFVVDILSAS
jgi:peptidylprolyl isomerase